MEAAMNETRDGAMNGMRQLIGRATLKTTGEATGKNHINGNLGKGLARGLSVPTGDAGIEADSLDRGVDRGTVDAEDDEDALILRDSQNAKTTGNNKHAGNIMLTYQETTIRSNSILIHGNCRAPVVTCKPTTVHTVQTTL